MTIHPKPKPQKQAPELDLNKLQPPSDGNYAEVVNRDNFAESADKSVRVYFRNFEEVLISFIRQSDMVLGCVAWFTHFDLLKELAAKQVAIVVQKEDFLRPDMGADDYWKKRLREKYNALSCKIDRYDFPNMISSLSTCGDSSIEAVRCVGNFNRDKKPAFPRMHNKFLVFAKLRENAGRTEILPYAVWTGSFNLTKNAINSLENALYITKEEIVRAYFQEFGQIMAISEKLDWESDWCAPEFRIGT